jgi:hypothetical protein
MTDFIGQTFPDGWFWSIYEKQCINSIRKQIDVKFSGQRNLLVNLTWFGPQFDYPGNAYAEFLKHKDTVDNLFILSTVDPSMLQQSQIESMLQQKGNPKLYKLGNFDGEYQFNFFAPVLAKHFRKYEHSQIVMSMPAWHFINYNRKPRQHRVNLVKKIIDSGLDKYGLLTLGRPDRTYDHDPENTLYLTLGEQDKDYVQYGHWFTNNNKDDDVGIPHDVLSLHNLEYWQKHFLHIIGATEFSVNTDLFVSETQFKPMIGLRPFLVNGNPETYNWLEQNGFKTFNRYFPEIDFMDHNHVHDSILSAIKHISNLTESKIVDLYESMMPDLLHNQQHFKKFAREQQYKIDNLF